MIQNANILHSYLLILVYENKYLLEIYLDNCAYEIVDKQVIDDLGENPFETDEDQFLTNR